MLNGDNPVKVEIVYERDRCIHEKSIVAKCTLCSQSCPNKAISTSGASVSPQFDADKCFHCGACLASCPHMAFVATNFSAQKIIERVAREDLLLLRCFVPYGEINYLASDANFYKIGTCLAALTPGTLFEISLDKHCIVATDYCKKCALYTTAGASLSQNLKSAKALLGDWHRADNLTESTPLFLSDIPLETCLQITAPNTHVSEGSQESCHEQTSTSQVDAHKATSFDIEASVQRLFGKKTQSKRSFSPPQGKFSTKAIKQHEIGWRRALQKLWKAASVEQTNGACYDWPAHSVDSNACRLCGTCVRVCPTDAMKHTFHRNEYTQLFTPGLCVDCGLCVVSCLHRALTRSHQVTATPFDEEVYFAERAAMCTRCGNPIPQKSHEQEFCRQCAIELRLEISSATEQQDV